MTNNIETNKNNTRYSSFDEAFDSMQNKIENSLISSPLVIRDYLSHLTKSRGKFIRAKALLICSKNETNMISDDAISIACAIEIIHLATLVHDDVIDDADMRRGRITLQKKYGVRTAVICGDYLLSIALRLVSEVSKKRDALQHNIPDYIGKVCLGELNQHINNGNYNLSTYRYLKILAGKTAALFEASFFSGALLAEEDIKIIKKYAKVGHYIGMVFQLTDDCMDFETTKNIAKKPVHSDYEQNVITLPLIHAFNVMKGLKEKAIKKSLSRKEINMAVYKTGGLKYTRRLAKKYQKKAYKLLDEIKMSQVKHEDISRIIDMSYREF